MWLPGAHTEAQLFVIYSCGTGSKLQPLFIDVVRADAFLAPPRTQEGEEFKQQLLGRTATVHAEREH